MALHGKQSQSPHCFLQYCHERAAFTNATDWQETPGFALRAWRAGALRDGVVGEAV